ncbi:hypothetical protein FHR25_005122 [Yokenella regensburgei]|nr:hypothetical protein FHR25_005122 [Yokenella regensburgei]
MSAAKLRHYGGGAVVHHYYDHRAQQHRQQTLTQEDMIGRYISHIPAKHFKMVRYYGFDEGIPAYRSVQMHPVR